ncbi:DUF4058 family protein [filamentous cyanobacterium LEGE 11480]|uniref:DUF4058 family protein n=1 Tax=Romeriopsis navalis LEGE 11480 TaxID=2777977 RepID=A0A928VQZ8_9CYAN|nr:DUF4058 family protein [Romeriopsis navalis]MBE9032183.1 DUF4058 family protein [Romeriopsis navalis LEGE 11480]
MASPFPGMDPYLEQSAFWSAFHSRLIVAIADTIEAHLDAAYYVEVETRTYLDSDGDGILVGIPDVNVVSTSRATDQSTQNTTATLASQPQTITLPTPEAVKERYLEIREVVSGQVITAIELLSPKNKRAGEGRHSYERKRQLILGSATHLVEIDLLRSGIAMQMTGIAAPSDYRIVVSRSWQRPQADLHAFSIRDPLPTIQIPLKATAPEITLDLQTVFEGVYRRSRYQTRIDYQQTVPPPQLSDSDKDWLQALLSQ